MAALLVGALSGASPFVPPPTAHGAAAAFFISRGHTPPHGQTPSRPHTAVHRLAQASIASCDARNGCGSMAGTNTALPSNQVHLDKAR